MLRSQGFHARLRTGARLPTGSVELPSKSPTKAAITSQTNGVPAFRHQPGACCRERENRNMKSHLSIAVALAAAVVFPAAGLAAAAPAAVHDAVLFYAIDRNGDGAIDRSEVDAIRVVIFELLDANGDGSVTQEEAGAVLLPAKPGQKEKAAANAAKRRQALLVKLDLAKPEGVPKDEFIGRDEAIFVKADKNQDGKVDRSEFAVLLDGFGNLLP
jgi:EF hand